MPEFSFKEFYDVVLKALQPITIGSHTVQTGEVVAAFDKISLANFDEVKKTAIASGGYGNRTLVTWSSTQQLNLVFYQGIFNERQLALMVNSKMMESTTETFTIHQREETELDGESLSGEYFLLKREPILTSNFHVYDDECNDITPSPLSKQEVEIQGKTYWKILMTGELGKEITVDYDFNYTNAKKIELGNELYNSYFELEGRTKVQDDISGEFRTGIIKIPKTKLVSNLSIKLGEKAQPVVGKVGLVCFPVGDWRQEKVMDIIFLDDDIDLEE